MNNCDYCHQIIKGGYVSDIDYKEKLVFCDEICEGLYVKFVLSVDKECNDSKSQEQP